MDGRICSSLQFWIYRLIEERNLDSDYKIADYGFENCDNPYIPFGTLLWEKDN